ncbi:MAG: DUF559 domain-containing protein [Desulfamplus sp.]|nr:DUF559 domain-containing protein [Desulfamplus sp.]
MKIYLTPAPSPFMERGEFIDGWLKKMVISGNYVSPDKKALARQFRKKPTSKEAEVWELLRNRQMMNLKWRRQQVIEGFIADFYCAQLHLALEIDGDVHTTEKSKEYDEERDAVFAGKGIQTIRITNSDCTRESLRNMIQQKLSPSPSLERGQGGGVR